MGRKSAENHRIRAIHLPTTFEWPVLVEFLQEAINAVMALTTIPSCPLHTPYHHRRPKNVMGR